MFTLAARAKVLNTCGNGLSLSLCVCVAQQFKRRAFRLAACLCAQLLLCVMVVSMRADGVRGCQNRHQLGRTTDAEAAHTLYHPHARIREAHRKTEGEPAKVAETGTIRGSNRARARLVVARHTYSAEIQC